MNSRRRFHRLLALTAGGLLAPDLSRLAWAQTAQAAPTRPWRIYQILFRGPTDVEKGFADYFARKQIPVEFIVRDVAQDASNTPALIQEARQMQADLIYTWGTPVTPAALGKMGKRNPQVHVTDIPVVFSMVSSPLDAGLVDSLQSSHANFTGAIHRATRLASTGDQRLPQTAPAGGLIYRQRAEFGGSDEGLLAKAAVQAGFQFQPYAVPVDALGQPQAVALPAELDKITAAALGLYPPLKVINYAEVTR